MLTLGALLGLAACYVGYVKSRSQNAQLLALPGMGAFLFAAAICYSIESS